MTTELRNPCEDIIREHIDKLIEILMQNIEESGIVTEDEIAQLKSAIDSARGGPG